MNRTTMVAFDRDYTILEAHGEFGWQLAPHIGKNVWDVFPDAVDTYLPVYEQAWEQGWCYRVIEYRGDLCQVHADAHEGTLRVQVTVLTVAGLEEFVRRARATGPQPRPQDAFPPQRHLRAV